MAVPRHVNLATIHVQHALGPIIISAHHVPQVPLEMIFLRSTELMGLALAQLHTMMLELYSVQCVIILAIHAAVILQMIVKRVPHLQIVWQFQV